MKLKGQVAIITGGGMGIGKTMALAFAREGAAVALVARTRGPLEEVAGQVRALGGKALPIVADVSQEAQVEALVQQAHGELGQIDILVNNASVSGPTAPVVEVALEDWSEALAVNLTGAMLCSREALKHMILRRKGNIINISSVAGQRGHALRSAYGASKWGLLGLTQTLALEAGHYGIRVNAICPGPVEGERMYRAIRVQAQALGISYEERLAQYLGPSPLGRMVTAEEVAAAALFLASEDSSGVTGQSVSVSAGLEMK